MVHPFEKILSDHETDKSDEPRPSRRVVLKLAAGGALAAVAAQASGQIATTMALGEEGGKGKRPGRPVATTRAVGEEGGNKGIIALPGQRGQISTHSRNFRTSLKSGNVEAAAGSLKKLENATKSAKGKNPYKRLVAGYRKQLDAALTAKLKRADRDLAAKKPIPAIKAYRAVSRIEGFKQQDQAKSKLAEAAKLEGHAEALSEVQAQELYDTADKAKNCDKLAIYEQTAKEYDKTPTGKKASKQAKTLAARLKRDETAAAGMLAKARKAKGSTQVRMLQVIASRYPDTSSGKIAIQMLPKKTPRPMPPRDLGRPIATTMAIGEEG
ncbi:MAG: hypothetical protein QGG42_15425 [Phycisphaerae bacterium]|jgi:hypothetical protein|nr:hypothetical protein [Phycisphaerae bacterium]